MIDGTQLYQDAIQRIQQLEKLNATLAAEIDRMQGLIYAVVEHRHSSHSRRSESACNVACQIIEEAIRDYEAS